MKTNYTYILFAVLLSFVACREKDIVDVGGTGVLKGTVTCFERPYSGPDGKGFVKVTVEGTDPVRTLQTDGAGNFQIDNLPMGTYNLVFEREGYGTNRVQGLAFVGGDEPLVTSFGLYKLPELEITDFELEANDFSYVWLTGSLYFDSPNDQESESDYMRYYLSDTPDVSPTHYRLTTAESFFSDLGYTPVNLLVNTTMFPSGTDLYVVAYPCAEDYQNYVDLTTGTKIFTTVAPKGSSVIKILVP